jgi:hypothetical protein
MCKWVSVVDGSRLATALSVKESRICYGVEDMRVEKYVSNDGT